MQPPAWIAEYIGREYDAMSWNCWTLCRELASTHLSLPKWPPYDFMDPADRNGVSSLMLAEARLSWREILDNAALKQGGRGESLGDIAILRYGHWSSHAALIVAPNKMLHVDEGTPTCIAEMRSQAWRDRVTGVYRWIS